MDEIHLDRSTLVRHRFARHGLARAAGSLATASDVDLLDFGVQDTGPDGSAWALAVRGAPSPSDGEVALAWTLRGAPHAYRTADLDAIAVATSPFSEADAGKRIFDAVKPLRAAGRTVLDALAEVADHERAIVTTPTVKGDVSGALNRRLPAPFLRECRPCQAIHIYEQPFRLAALQAGLMLEPGTSPPVLRRVTGLTPRRFGCSGADADPRFHVIRNHLRFWPGSTVGDVAATLDSPRKDVRAQWPDDVVAVVVDDDPRAKPEPRFALAEDADALRAEPPLDGRTVTLLGPYDPYLQLHDRDLLVPDPAHRKDVWRVLGRPGAVVADGELIGTWRPRSSGASFSIEVAPWVRATAADKTAIAERAEALAAHRGKTLKAVTMG